MPSILTISTEDREETSTPPTAPGASSPKALAPRILNFQTTEAIIHPGYPTIFSWEVEGADTLHLSGGVGEVSGRSFIEAYLHEPGPYRLTATNAHGAITATVELRLPLPAIESFFAGGYTIKAGVPVSLFWEVQDATELVLEPHHEPVHDLTRIEVLPDRTTTYELVARNSSGEVRRSLTLTLPAPDILSFEGDSVSTEGEPIRLEWMVENAYRVTIEPGIGVVEAQGSLRVRPPAPFTKYQLCAEGHSGTTYASFEVVRFPIPIELDDLDTELDSLLTMPHQLPDHDQLDLADLAAHQPPGAGQEIPAHDPTDATPPVADDPKIRRVQEMALKPELLDMKKAHVRTEVKYALRKIKRLLKRKLKQ